MSTNIKLPMSTDYFTKFKCGDEDVVDLAE